MGLRRLRPSPWLRLRSGWRTGTAACIGTLGLLGTLITISGAAGVKFTPVSIAAAVSISVLVGLAAAYVRARSKLFPDSIVGEIGADGHFHAQLCSSGGLSEACGMTRASYGQAYVKDDVAEQWRLKNPYAFVQVMNAENRLCACFGILALRRGFMEQFIAGLVSDQQLRGENVLGWHESKEATQLYLSGIVVSEPASHKSHRRAAVMFWAMLEYVRQLYGLAKPRQLYAVAVTDDSHRLMKNLGFVVETPAARRTDQSDLYRFDLTESSWNDLLCELNDWSRLCTIDFTLHEHDGAGSRSVDPSQAAANCSVPIMFVAGDRGGSQRNQAQIPKEFRSIEEAIRGSEYRDVFVIAPPLLGATRQTIVEAYRHRPLILHFAGNGDDRSLSFLLDQGVLVSQTNIAAEQLAGILGAFPTRVSLCVLNTCESASIAAHLVQGDVVDAAIGWPTKVADDTAIAFSRALYGRLGDGLALSKSVTLAAQGCGAGEPPILYIGVNVDPHLVYAPAGTTE